MRLDSPGSNPDLEIVRKFESAGPEELAALLARPTGDEDRVLRRHLGEPRYRRLRRIALDQGTGPRKDRGIFDLFRPQEPTPPRRKMGGVVVIPGFMGSGLTVTGRDGSDPIWLSYWRIALGRIERLALADDGLTSADPNDVVTPEGVLNRYHGELILSLSRAWEVRSLAYDWRTDLGLAADALALLIRSELRGIRPIHLVAHSLGGLVARVFIKRYPELWVEMSAGNADDKLGRLVMLGTPNHGSYLPVQTLGGVGETIQNIALLDQRHDRLQLRRIVSSFPVLFQLLPSPAVDPEAERFLDVATYAGIGLGIRPEHIEKAKLLQSDLGTLSPTDAARMVYIAGNGQSTCSGVVRGGDLKEPSAYESTTSGDGSVTHHLGLLGGVKTFFVKEEHSALLTNPQVLGSLDTILRVGKADNLAGGQVVSRGLMSSRGRAASVNDKGREENRKRIEELVNHIRLPLQGRLAMGLGPAASRSAAIAARTDLDPSFIDLDVGRELEDRILRGVLGGTVSPSEPTEAEGSVEPSVAPSTLRVKLKFGSIADLFQGENQAVAVGHYQGVRPSGSEERLDAYISESGVKREHRVIEEFSRRRLIEGRLGRPFLLRNEGTRDKTLAVVGLGPYGRCGVPELTTAIRELWWSLGRLGVKHLSSLLIGAGNGNLSIGEAIDAWLEAFESAVQETEGGERIETWTIIEHDPERLLTIREALTRRSAGSVFRLEYDPASIDPESLRASFAKHAEDRFGHLATPATRDRDPVRISIGMDLDRPADKSGKRSFRFSVLTQTASVPERIARIDSRIVESTNDQLAATKSATDQARLGLMLGEYLFPDDLREHIRQPGPLVMQLDSATARVHWEVVALPKPLHEKLETDDHPLDRDTRFFGLSRGLTRQLRASFGSAPVPPPPPRDRLRVLIVADPSEDMPLTGAEQEGLLLLELFEAFNRSRSGAAGNSVEVKALIGPREATRSNVLAELLTKRYDVLHYAGHCAFVKDRPEESGWIFGRDEVFSVVEIERIDRVPALVFSNSCESGVTQANPGARSAGLVPNFAESFFAKGVSNFICTAWPIDDAAAKRFAAVFHGEMLGFGYDEELKKFVPSTPALLHEAMRKARRLIAATPSGRSTWGAYQHYGNPFHRYFASDRSADE